MIADDQWRKSPTTPNSRPEPAAELQLNQQRTPPAAMLDSGGKRRCRSLSELPGHLRVPVLRRKDTERTQARLEAGQAGLAELRQLREQQTAKMRQTMAAATGRQRQQRPETARRRLLAGPSELEMEEQDGDQVFSSTSLSSLPQGGDNRAGGWDGGGTRGNLRTLSGGSLSLHTAGHYGVASKENRHDGWGSDTRPPLSANVHWQHTTDTCERSKQIQQKNTAAHEQQNRADRNQIENRSLQEHSHAFNHHWDNKSNDDDINNKGHNSSNHINKNNSNNNKINNNGNSNNRNGELREVSYQGRFNGRTPAKGSHRGSAARYEGASNGKKQGVFLTEQSEKSGPHRFIHTRAGSVDESLTSRLTSGARYMSWDNLLSLVGLHSYRDDAEDLQDDDTSSCQDNYENRSNYTSNIDVSLRSPVQSAPHMKMGRSYSFCCGGTPHAVAVTPKLLRTPCWDKQTPCKKDAEGQNVTVTEADNTQPPEMGVQDACPQLPASSQQDSERAASAILRRASIQCETVLTGGGAHKRKIFNPLHEIDMEALSSPGPLHAVTLQYSGIPRYTGIANARAGGSDTGAGDIESVAAGDVGGSGGKPKPARGRSASLSCEGTGNFLKSEIGRVPTTEEQLTLLKSQLSLMPRTGRVSRQPVSQNLQPILENVSNRTRSPVPLDTPAQGQNTQGEGHLSRDTKHEEPATINRTSVVQESLGESVEPNTISSIVAELRQRPTQQDMVPLNLEKSNQPHQRGQKEVNSQTISETMKKESFHEETTHKKSPLQNPCALATSSPNILPLSFSQKPQSQNPTANPSETTMKIPNSEQRTTESAPDIPHASFEPEAVFDFVLPNRYPSQPTTPLSTPTATKNDSQGPSSHYKSPVQTQTQHNPAVNLNSKQPCPEQPSVPQSCLQKTPSHPSITSHPFPTPQATQPCSTAHPSPTTHQQTSTSTDVSLILSDDGYSTCGSFSPHSRLSIGHASCSSSSDWSSLSSGSISNVSIASSLLPPASIAIGRLPRAARSSHPPGRSAGVAPKLRSMSCGGATRPDAWPHVSMLAHVPEGSSSDVSSAGTPTSPCLPPSTTKTEVSESQREWTPTISGPHHRHGAPVLSENRAAPLVFGSGPPSPDMESVFLDEEPPCPALRGDTPQGGAESDGNVAMLSPGESHQTKPTSSLSDHGGEPWRSGVPSLERRGVAVLEKGAIIRLAAKSQAELPGQDLEYPSHFSEGQGSKNNSRSIKRVAGRNHLAPNKGVKQTAV